MSYGWNSHFTLPYPTDSLIEQVPYSTGNQTQSSYSDINFQLANELFPGIRLSLARSETVQQLQYAESPLCETRAKVSIRLQVMCHTYFWHRFLSINDGFSL